MDSSLTCPNCGHSHAIPQEYLGHAVICPKCHARFRAGEPAAAVSAEAEAHEDTVITCPTCAYSHAVPDAYIGRVVVCPRCHGHFTVQTPDALHGEIELPASTAWPLVLATGIALVAAGLATSLVLSVLGLIIFVFGLGGWIACLLPGKGHVHEPLVPPSLRRQPIYGTAGGVDVLRPGMAGHRLRLPEKVHPISAGIRGGIVGGMVMPVPALAYGLLSGYGIWLPINLLAGTVMPAVEDMTVEQLSEFSPVLLGVAVAIHAVLSVGIGMIYGVLLPTLPPMPGGPVIWGGIVMPLMWTGASYGLMGAINPPLQEHVNWYWFLLSQFVYGIVTAVVVIRSEKVPVDQRPPVG